MRRLLHSRLRRVAPRRRSAGGQASLPKVGKFLRLSTQLYRVHTITITTFLPTEHTSHIF